MTRDLNLIPYGPLGYTMYDAVKGTAMRFREQHDDRTTGSAMLLTIGRDRVESYLLALEAAAEELLRMQALREENNELRGIISAYEADVDYARSRFRQIDLLRDQRIHDRLKLQSLEKSFNTSQAKLAQVEKLLRWIRRVVRINPKLNTQLLEIHTRLQEYFTEQRYAND